MADSLRKSEYLVGWVEERDPPASWWGSFLDPPYHLTDLMPFLIRPATPNDTDLVVRWNIRLAEESEDKTLSAEILTRGVRQVLADQQKGRYFIAMDGARPIGQTMVTYEWSDWRNGWIWWIQSVYVEADYRRRGVYRALHNHIAEVAKRSGEVVGLRLYVEQNNTVAREVYQSCGLRPAGYLVYEHMFGGATSNVQD